MNVYLHGFGTSASRFRAIWEEAGVVPGGHYPNGYEHDPLTGLDRWFVPTGREGELTRALETCADRLEDDLAQTLGTAGGGRISLYGHSQGGMLALALARRRRLPLDRVEAFAAYVPPSSAGSAEDLGGVSIVLHSSLADRYIPPERVKRSAAELRAAGAEVEERVSADLEHAFSAAWIAAAGGCPL